MSYPTYPEYRDSGVAWWGQIPSHWHVRKVAWHMPYIVGWTPPSGDEDYYGGDLPWVTIADMDGEVISDTAAKITRLAVDARSARLVPAGSLLFSFKLSVGKVAVNAIAVYTNEAIASFLPNETVSLRYWRFAAPLIVPHFGRENIYGALLLNQELIDSVRFFAPALDEQNAIASFLESETARIDALIAEQQRLIELLQEKRQAVITQAVTKGLDPSVPMKDSGVEWLGQVPEHWQVGALRWFGSVQGGVAMGKKYDIGTDLVRLPYLRTANVQAGYLDLSEIKEVAVLRSEVARYSLQLGDVLMVEGGDNDKLGRGTVWRAEIDPCLHQNHVFAVRPTPELSPDWLASYTQSDPARAYFFISSRQSTNLASISNTNIMGLQVPIPPRVEQEAILSELKVRTGKYEELEVTAIEAMRLLTERRSALISAAVTGKIDVRNWRPPEATAAPEPVELVVHG